MAGTGGRAGATRQRVLEATLGLFNERGFGVTVAEIAAACGMREGNLHYHFRKKELLIATLFERFQEEELAVAEAELGDAAAAESYAEYQLGWFALMWRYRCFYRDAFNLQHRLPGLKGRFMEVQARASAAVARVMALATEHGFLAIPAGRIRGFVTNVWIVSSYWMDYLRTSTASAGLTEQQMQWGFGQVMALFEPYLTPAGRAAFSPLAQRAAALVMREDEPGGRG